MAFFGRRYNTDTMMKTFCFLSSLLFALMIFAGCESTGSIADPVNPKTVGNPESANSVLANIGNTTVLVEFEKTGCKLCHEMRPYVDDLVKDTGIRLIRETADGQMIGTFEIQKFPTVILYRNGKEIERWSGANDPDQIRKMVRKVMQAKS